MDGKTNTGNGAIDCKHIVISADLAKKIRSGLLTGKLPGVVKLAAEYKVNPLTICKALDTLEDFGLIERRSRIGTFVKHKKRIGVFFLTRRGQPNPEPPRRRPQLPMLYNIVSDGIASVVAAREFSMLVQAVNPDHSEYLTYLKSEVDGAVILHAGDQVSEKDSLLFQDIPFVRAMGQPIPGFDHTHISYNNQATGRLAADYLRQQGCQTAIYVGGFNLQIGIERFESFRANLGDLRLEPFHLDLAVVTVPEFLEQGNRLLPEILDRNRDRKIGVFLTGDVYISPFYQLLRRFGLEPMSDIPVISCDNNFYALQGVHPLPAEIDIKAYEIGRLSAEILIKQLENTPAPSGKILLEPEIL